MTEQNRPRHTNIHLFFSEFPYHLLRQGHSNIFIVYYLQAIYQCLCRSGLDQLLHTNECHLQLCRSVFIVCCFKKKYFSVHNFSFFFYTILDKLTLLFLYNFISTNKNNCQTKKNLYYNKNED